MVEFNQWHIEELTLDVDSNTQGSIPVIYGRQGDKDGILCNIELTQQGVPVNQDWFNGKRLFYEARGNGVSVRKQVDAISGNVVKVVIPQAVFTNIGLVNENFLRVEDATTGELIISATTSFKVYVRQGNLDPYASQYYLEEIEAISNEFNKWFRQVRNTLQSDTAAALSAKVVELENEKVEVTEYVQNKEAVFLQLALKADTSYLESVLSTYSGGGVKDVYYSLSSLNTAHPNGTVGPMLVYDTVHSDGGHLYTWVVSEWKDIGLFNPEGIADKSVTAPKIADGAVVKSHVRFIDEGSNLFNKNTVAFNYSINPTNGLLIANSAYAAGKPFDVVEGQTVAFGKSTENSSRYAFYNEDVFILSDVVARTERYKAVKVPEGATRCIYAVSKLDLDVAQVSRGNVLLPYQAYRVPRLLETNQALEQDEITVTYENGAIKSITEGDKITTVTYTDGILTGFTDATAGRSVRSALYYEDNQLVRIAKEVL